MASHKQQVYRKLMREQKAKGSSGSERVNHPLARYNSLGQLSCVVCNLHVKSELLWATHLISRRHKEMVAALKRQTLSPATRSNTDSSDAQKETESVGFMKQSTPSTAKRKPLEDAESVPPVSKKAKVESEGLDRKGTLSGLPSDFFDQGPSHPTNDSGGEEEEEDEKEEGGVELLSSTVSETFPSDKQVEGKDTQQTRERKRSHDAKDALPEGFFDDPKQDAKVRKVEYRDPVQEEWEKFQKSIQREDEVSEALLFEGDEETKTERELTEINEQVDCYNRAERLRLRQEELTARKMEWESHRMEGTCEEEGAENLEVSTSSDELEFNEFLDWRARIS